MRKLTILLLCMLVPEIGFSASTQSPTPSGGPLTCPQIFLLADKALADQKAQIQIRDLRLVNNGTQITALSAEIAGLKTPHWYNDKFLLIGVGVIAGGLIVGRFK